MKRMYIAMLSTIIAAVFLFCSAVPEAQAYPSNIVRYKVGTIRAKVNKNYPENDMRRSYYNVKITYTNVSRNKIITVFFNKTLRMDGKLKFNNSGFIAYGKFSKPSKVELYPGQSVTQGYNVPVFRILGKIENYRLKDYIRTFNNSFSNGKHHTMPKITHDFGVRTKPL